MSNFINDQYIIDFKVPSGLKPLIDELEEADRINDFGKYFVAADNLDPAAKAYYSMGRISKRDWDLLLKRYVY